MIGGNRSQATARGRRGAGVPAGTRPEDRRAGRAGFTLLEVLLVIATIGILAAVLVVGSTRLVKDKPLSAEQVFWTAVAEARRYALLHRTDVRLAYDAEQRAFHARTIEGSQSFPVPGEGDLRIDFLSTQSGGGSSVLIGGTLVETQPLPAITFFADGTCTPFRAQLRAGSSVHVIAIDPWTCAPVLEPGTTT